MQAVLSLVLCWLSIGTAAAQTSDQRDALQEMVDELAPLVETTAGRHFFTIPEVVLANPAILAKVFQAEQQHLLQALSDVDEAQAAETASQTAGNLSSAFVGKYGFLDKKLYIDARSIAWVLQDRGIDPALFRPVTQLVIAHELTHALQDQHVDLGAVASSRTGADGVMAVNCLVEGHAVWIHEQVGEALGYDDAVALVGQILGYDLGYDISSDPDRFYTSYVYGQGRQFVAHHAAEGGLERTWRMIANPPGATSMIVDPKSYNPYVAPAWDPAVRAAIAAARMHITPHRWRPADQQIGDYDLRDSLVRSRGSQRLAAHWVAGWRSGAAKKDNSWAEVALLAFDSETAAWDYVAQMRSQAELDLARIALPMATAFLPQVTGDVRGFDAIASDEAAQEELRMQYPNKAPHEMRSVWVANRSYVVQVRAVNHRVSDRRLGRAIRHVFRSLE